MVDTSCSSPLCPVLPYKSVWTQAGQALLGAATPSQRTNCFEVQEPSLEATNFLDILSGV